MGIQYNGSYVITFTDEFSGTTYYTWNTSNSSSSLFMIPASAPVVTPYEPSLSIVSPVDTDYVLDLTEAVTGRVMKGRMTGSWEFVLDTGSSGMTSEAMYHNIREKLHGKWLAVQIDGDARIYSGRIYIADFKVGGSYSTITLNYNLGVKGQSLISKKENNEQKVIKEETGEPLDFSVPDEPQLYYLDVEYVNPAADAFEFYVDEDVEEDTEDYSGDDYIISDGNKIASITFTNDDGNILYWTYFTVGLDVQYPYGMPTSAEYGSSATFLRWDPEPNSLSGDGIVTAVYDLSNLIFTIRFLNDDGDILQEDQVGYGEEIWYKGNEPRSGIYSRTDDSEMETNNEDEDTAELVTGDLEVYNESDNSEEDDDEEEAIEDLDGGELIVADNTEVNIPFLYWKNGDLELSLSDHLVVTKNVSLTAKYDLSFLRFVVTFLNDDGSILYIRNNVGYGESAIYDGVWPPQHSQYPNDISFLGWDRPINSVTDNMTVKALYDYTNSGLIFTVNYYNDDGTTLLDVSHVSYGGSSFYSKSNEPVSTVYGNQAIFTGWSVLNGSLNYITEDINVIATYDFTGVLFTVTFVNDSGTIIAVYNNVAYGTTITPPLNEPISEIPGQENASFIDWDGDFNYITSDITVTAVYDYIDTSELVYTITFEDDGNNTLLTLSVPYGDTPSYTLASAPKSKKVKSGAVFTGWDSALVPAYESKKYKAVFDYSNAICTVKFLLNGWYGDPTGLTTYDSEGYAYITDSTLCEYEVSYNSDIEYAGPEPEEPYTENATFSGWVDTYDRKTIITSSLRGRIRITKNIELITKWRYSSYKTKVRFYNDIATSSNMKNGEDTNLLFISNDGLKTTKLAMEYLKYKDLDLYSGSIPKSKISGHSKWIFRGFELKYGSTKSARVYQAVFDEPLENEITDTWEEINDNIMNNTYKDKYKIGQFKRAYYPIGYLTDSNDLRTFKIKRYEYDYFMLVAFDKDSLADYYDEDTVNAQYRYSGTKARTTWIICKHPCNGLSSLAYRYSKNKYNFFGTRVDVKMPFYSSSKGRTEYLNHAHPGKFFTDMAKDGWGSSQIRVIMNDWQGIYTNTYGKAYYNTETGDHDLFCPYSYSLPYMYEFYKYVKIVKKTYIKADEVWGQTYDDMISEDRFWLLSTREVNGENDQNELIGIEKNGPVYSSVFKSGKPKTRQIITPSDSKILESVYNPNNDSWQQEYVQYTDDKPIGFFLRSAHRNASTTSRGGQQVVKDTGKLSVEWANAKSGSLTRMAYGSVFGFCI